MASLEMISVAFVEPESPGNIGFLARTMKNFGLSDLILVDGCELGEDAWTFAMHAKDVIKRSRRMSWAELTDLGFDFLVGTTSRQGHDSNLRRVAIGPEELGRSLAAIEGSICIVLGREGNGLSLEELEACDVVVSVTASPQYSAMNVSHAAAVIFYEIFKASGRRGKSRKMREADVTEKEVLLREASSMIESSGLPEHRKRASMLVFSRVINRAFISGRECHTLIGLMKELSKDPTRPARRRPPSSTPQTPRRDSLRRRPPA